MKTKEIAFVETFDDYHEVRKFGPLKAKELGFVEPFSCYVGLFYTGKKPSQEAIVKMLKKHPSLRSSLDDEMFEALARGKSIFIDEDGEDYAE